jgi:hypothetical protein
MVSRRFLGALWLAVLISIVFTGTVRAQWHYHLEQEWAKIWINPDGTIDLFYNISITQELDSQRDINHVNVGQPNGDFTIGNATDQDNRLLTTSDASSGTDYKVQVNLALPLKPGQTVWFTLTTNVAHMIYEDNQTNVGMEFWPAWWNETTVARLNVSIVLPPGVNTSMVGTSANWDGTWIEPDGRLSTYWERQNLIPGQVYSFGVSFPKEYVQNYETQATGLVAFLQQYGPVLFVLLILIIIAVAVAMAVRKRAYLMPTISMETLGIRRGLTAVEASYLLDMKPTKIVTEILYSLLQKRVVWVESTTPSIKLKIMPAFQNKTGTVEAPLRYYEIDFLHALKEDGTFDEERLAQTIMSLRDTVEEKLRGYCRRDTIDYYKKVAEKAWKQVEQAGTPDLASKAYDEQLLWLFLDPNYQTRTQTAFHDRTFEPSPLWLWYWYSYQNYYPHPTYRPNVETPAQAAKPPSIPGAEFASNIASAVEKTSNNIVVNLEKFANSILPMPAGKSSTEPAHHNADCVCACAACACACACVSCACACAGGGVG